MNRERMIGLLAVHAIANSLVASDNRSPPGVHTEMRWTLTRLEPLLPEFAQGRSFAEGRRLYRIARCTKCHRMDGEGHEFGPDLTKLKSDLTVRELSKQIVEPSSKINKDHQVTVFRLQSGQVVQGLIVATSQNFLRVLENPLRSTETRKVPFDDIDQQSKSRISLMPNGLLDGLKSTEVLDLLAYVYARGNDRHNIYAKAASKK